MAFPSSTSDADRARAPVAWDLVLQPRLDWFELRLSELWRYRDLIRLFVRRDFLAQYKQTFLGPLWHLLQPLLTSLLYAVIFGHMARLPTDGASPVLFYLAGVTCWTYFADSLSRTSGTFIQNAAIFGKVYFPRLAVPISVVLSNLVKFGIQLALLVAFIGVYAVRGTVVLPRESVLLLPILVLIMAALGLGLGLIVSALTTHYRDLQVLVAFGIQLLMFATPVIYPVSLFPARFRWVILVNPMASIVEAFRAALIGAGAISFPGLTYSALVSAALMTIGVMLFHRVERTVMDTV